MEKRKLGNVKQIMSAYEMEITSGTATGKKILLVNNGAMEVMFNCDNALDIGWVKYHGQNISFLTKNGFNNNAGPFGQKFEGGFIYTCGLDNVSSCDKEQAIHGSLHYRKAENLRYEVGEDKIEVFATIYNTQLFGQNLILNRHYTVFEDKILLDDTIENQGFKPTGYVALYHVNFGYPFLDEGLELDFNATKTIPANAKSVNTIDDCKKIVAPQDEGSEDLFFHILDKGEVSLKNNKLKISCKMEYDVNKLPYLVEWRNLYSGDYVLGIEPSTVRFDEFKRIELKPEEKANLQISFSFNKF
ncbi:MAG: DUF4432 family protein [Clostridiales bacterium]|nr:DUF4432 family protein [Clostridiales bacterium]